MMEEDDDSITTASCTNDGSDESILSSGPTEKTGPTDIGNMKNFFMRTIPLRNLISKIKSVSLQVA